jgi:hypothetical protein
MKFYPVSKFENKKDVQKLIYILNQEGYEITYDWTQDTSVQTIDKALNDMNGVKDADFIVGLFTKSMSYKGSFAELGMAALLNIPTFIIGNYADKVIFTELPNFYKCTNTEDLIHRIRTYVFPTSKSKKETTMKLKILGIKTAQGYLSFAPSQDFNPDGTPKVEGKICIEYRPTCGGWEEIELELPDDTPIPPPNPIPPDPNPVPPNTLGPDVDPNNPSLREPYKCPTGTNFKDFTESDQFIMMGRQVGYGNGFTCSAEDKAYWHEKKIELLKRGAELAQVPPEKYFWERLMGRGAGGADTATQGPYAGLEHYEGSLTP